MFLINKYSVHYFKLISKAKNQNRIKSKKIYFEDHHIIPKSLNGTDDKSNLVLLTAREHYIAHLLLTKAVNKKYKLKMIIAFDYMNTQIKNDNRRYSSRIYNIHRKNFHKFYSEKAKNSTWLYNPTTNKESFIHSSKVEKFLTKGYQIGRNPSSIAIITEKRRSYKGRGNPRFGSKNAKLSSRNKLPKRWITNKIEDKLILREEEEKYLQSGWFIGRTQSNNLGKKHKK